MTDRPQTPDILVSARTEAYLRHYAPNTPLPDEVHCDDEGDPLICVFDWTALDTLGEATTAALGQVSEGEVKIEEGYTTHREVISRLTTLRYLLAGMQTGVEESIARVGELPRGMGVEM